MVEADALRFYTLCRARRGRTAEPNTAVASAMDHFEVVREGGNVSLRTVPDLGARRPRRSNEHRGGSCNLLSEST